MRSRNTVQGFTLPSVPRPPSRAASLGTFDTTRWITNRLSSRSIESMKKQTQSETQQLEIILETALMLAAPGTSIPSLAERIYDAEPDLVQQIQRPWIVSRFEWMLYRKQRNIPVEGQMTLPGIPRLPVRMTLKDGTRPFLMQGNLKQLQEFRDVLSKRKGARLRAVEKLIALMTAYAKTRSGITVAEVLNAELRVH